MHNVIAVDGKSVVGCGWDVETTTVVGGTMNIRRRLMLWTIAPAAMFNSLPAFARGGGSRGGGSHSSSPRSSGSRATGTGSNPSSHSVGGYTTKNGTYVAPHHATDPNGTTRDNYSTRGNVNPYTGKAGTRTPKD